MRYIAKSCRLTHSSAVIWHWQLSSLFSFPVELLTNLNASPPTTVMNTSYMQRCLVKIIAPCVASAAGCSWVVLSKETIECHGPWWDLSTVISFLLFQSMQTSTVHTGFAFRCRLWCLALSCSTGTGLFLEMVLAKNPSKRPNHTSRKNRHVHQ